MYLLKACPKCDGDVVSDRDWYGPYIRCLQCGLMKDLPQASSKAARTKPEIVWEREVA